MKIKSYCDFWSGVMFITIGAAFAMGAAQYAFGSSARPGPGYFPLGLGLLLVSLGLGVVMQSLGRTDKRVAGHGDPDPVGLWAWRPLFTVTASVVLFGMALPYLGLLMTLPILVVLISTTVRDFRWISVLTAATILTLTSYLIFVLGLGLPIPVLPAVSG